jgi:hypothetical protein
MHIIVYMLIYIIAVCMLPSAVANVICTTRPECSNFRGIVNVHFFN